MSSIAQPLKAPSFRDRLFLAALDPGTTGFFFLVPHLKGWNGLSQERLSQSGKRMILCLVISVRNVASQVLKNQIRPLAILLRFQTNGALLRTTV